MVLKQVFEGKQKKSEILAIINWYMEMLKNIVDSLDGSLNIELIAMSK